MSHPQPQSHQSRGFPHREKPQFLHVIIGAGVVVLSYYLLLFSFRPFLADATAHLLSLGRILVENSQGLEPPSLVLRLMNGSDLNVALTWQRSGISSIIVFWILFVSLALPLKGSLWLKIVWLEFGSLVGLTWSFIRFCATALVAHHLGADAFALAEFVTSPVLDFLWVIPVWSLGLSAVVSSKKKEHSRKRG